jgi:hypothetical protein
LLKTFSSIFFYLPVVFLKDYGGPQIVENVDLSVLEQSWLFAGSFSKNFPNWNETHEILLWLAQTVKDNLHSLLNIACECSLSWPLLLYSSCYNIKSRRKRKVTFWRKRLRRKIKTKPTIRPKIGPKETKISVLQVVWCALHNGRIKKTDENFFSKIFFTVKNLFFLKKRISKPILAALVSIFRFSTKNNL